MIFIFENKFEMSREVCAKTSLDLLFYDSTFLSFKSVSNSPEHSRSAADLIKAQNGLIAYGRKHQVLQISSHFRGFHFYPLCLIFFLNLFASIILGASSLTAFSLTWNTFSSKRPSLTIIYVAF